jgi:hypothetical protein
MYKFRLIDKNYVTMRGPTKLPLDDFSLLSFFTHGDLYMVEQSHVRIREQGSCRFCVS